MSQIISMDILQKLRKMAVKHSQAAFLYSSGSAYSRWMTFEGITSGGTDWLSETNHTQVKVNSKLQSIQPLLFLPFESEAKATTFHRGLDCHMVPVTITDGVCPQTSANRDTLYARTLPRIQACHFKCYFSFFQGMSYLHTLESFGFCTSIIRAC